MTTTSQAKMAELLRKPEIAQLKRAAQEGKDEQFITSLARLMRIAERIGRDGREGRET
jgi:hypothetical protein